MLGQTNKFLSPYSTTPEAKDKIYSTTLQKGARLWPTLAELVIKVGHLQLLRRLISQELNYSCKFDSKFLSNALECLNRSLVGDIQAHYADPTKPYPSTDSPLMSEACSYLETAGIGDPLRKIYITTKKLDHLALVVFFLTVSQLQRLAYNRKFVLVSKFFLYTVSECKI